ncbi:MAG: hypothetical protein A9Z00_10090 [Thermobacillus sp. ZCTH02-B1]|uniref:hypothetical protein n=1 Tax=Thermobacillus sp. ZCTH02-B1 TaxID=1858795 RepID=UPI000B552A28|nr:hypothetical protein [Thermobacillus sp. ZCTH02-B1]OUM97404.1 MAG: hypothetical protein A9Z00_10090 [Thermobacillus sp. ZCTH02-B1]
MEIIITESGMEFGPFKAEQVFHIEQSEIYAKLIKSFRIAEFLLIQKEHNRLLIVEAKSSSPHPGNSKEKFREFISNVAEKMIHAWQLTISLLMRRHGQFHDELPAEFRELANYASLDIVFMLIIRGHKKEWLVNVKDALDQHLRHVRKIWNARVIVYNDEQALSKGLVKKII